MVKNMPANAGHIGDAGSISGSGRSPRGGHGNPLQYSCLENPVDREDWKAEVHRVTQSWTWLKWPSSSSMKARGSFWQIKTFSSATRGQRRMKIRAITELKSSRILCVHVLRHVWFFVTPWTAACPSPLSIGILQARILGWVAISFHGGYSSTKGSSSGRPHCRQILYHLSQQGSPPVT